MSEWNDRYAGHAVHTLAAQLGQHLKASHDRDENEAVEFAALSRLVGVHALVESTLASLDPELAPVGEFNPLQQALQNCVNETKSFADNGNQQHLNNANAHADQLLQALVPFRAFSSTEGSAGERLSDYRGRVDEHLRSVDARRQKLETELAALKERAGEAGDMTESWGTSV